MATVTKPIALDESLNTTEQTPRNVADVLAQELARIAGRQASDVNYDNTASGLTADNVQEAIDELKSDIPTVNDGTLTIQQNGETKGTFTANQSGNSTVNIETPTAEIQTAVDEFETYNGGLLSECKVALSPIQDLSHGDPSPTNICPITGHTQVEVGDDGKNKANISSNTVGSNQKATVEYDNNIIRLTATGTYARCGWLIPVEVGETYTFSCKGITSAIGGTMVNYIYLGSADGTWSDSSPNYISRVQLTTTSRDVNITFTATTNVCFIGVYIASTATSGVITLTDVQLELGSTATAYVPYNGYQVTVNLGGTYYSGTLDVVSGVLTATWVSERMLNTYGWSLNATPITDRRFQWNYGSGTAIPKGINQNGTFICSHLKPSNIGINNTPFGYFYISQRWVVIPDRDSFFATLDDFKNWLSDNEVYICYKLATPQTIQLTPQQVKALVGENHLSAPLEGQEITESKYKKMFTFDDVIAYIQSLS